MNPMKDTYNKPYQPLPALLPESGPEPAAPFWRTDDTELDRLKTRLLRQALTHADGTALVVAMRRASNEAAALAWLEPFPMLVLPELFAEKVDQARKRVLRQEQIRNRSAQILRDAA